MMKNAIIVVLLILVIFLYVYSVYNKEQLYKNGLTGMWISSTEFLEKAEIDGMYMYIGDPYDGRSRKAYIVMHSNNQIIAEMKYDIEICRNVHDFLPFIDQTISQSIILENEDEDVDDDVDDEENRLIPKKLQLKYNIADSHITLIGEDETVYADLYKSEL